MQRTNDAYHMVLSDAFDVSACRIREQPCDRLLHAFFSIISLAREIRKLSPRYRVIITSERCRRFQPSRREDLQLELCLSSSDTTIDFWQSYGELLTSRCMCGQERVEFELEQFGGCA